jgi:SAM-dependent methyltransferase
MGPVVDLGSGQAPRYFDVLGGLRIADARVMDFLSLDFPPASFDAVYAMNCLLHVPSADLPAVLQKLNALVRPGGLCFLGQYGGSGAEGYAEQDSHDPPRFFAFRTDPEVQGFARMFFEIIDFHVVGEGPDRFQSLTVRRAAGRVS